MPAFRTAFGYFNTFGRNPVSCAAAAATLDVIENENLQENAHLTGLHALDRLNRISHPLKVEARGLGLFFGVEFAYEDGTPATEFAAHVVEQMRHEGILMNRIGRHMNTLKMRPPMPFDVTHADLAIDTLEHVLALAPL